MAATSPRTKSKAAAVVPATTAERAVAPSRHSSKPATASTPTATVKPPPKAPPTRKRNGPRRTAAVKASPTGEVDLEGLRSALKAAILEHHPTADLTDVDRAFDMAVEAHAGTPRATGEPYVTHPIASAQILAELGIDPIAIEAALLHDVPEDTEYSLTDIEDRFNAEVAHLVDGVTKLSRFSTHSHEQQQAENIRKMLLAMAEDIRVVLIKLADRLHNMRTL
jgi:GTP pyrophosphokinase